MANKNNGNGTAMAPTIRCAIYTRKSTEEGLSQDFNSLDAQRDAGTAYIRSQAGEGWTLLPEQYDDGGYTGANMERPALRRLLADVKAGKVNCVVVYKVDRLTRSLFDFARIVEVLDKQGAKVPNLRQMFTVYAPASDRNDPEAYARFVARALGVPATTPVDKLITS